MAALAKLSEKIITNYLENQNIKKDKDVEELYLARQGLTEVCSLRQFKFLKHLWLNGNKLRRVNCLNGNCRLVELYLHNNEIIEISGALQHLTCLKLLFLNNNQLTRLDSVLSELKKMNCLQTLNLFDNPIAQEPDYRIHVINALKSVVLLDRQEVNNLERNMAHKVYQQERNHVSESVAFGRRSQGSPGLYHQFNSLKCEATKFDNRDIGNSFLRDQVLHETHEDACNDRRSKKSIMLYTCLDWSKVPRIEERRTSEHPFDSPEIVTHVYR
ncbi:hypothetical protein SNE40_002515 [Patella caerulea]|uniref:Uncharacterized protein n=1 Tax=Patella caerulea TaxID=87958 RepID=A0AAN8Q7J5_PATCE